LQILEAATAVMLIGIMPVYVTAALGVLSLQRRYRCSGRCSTPGSRCRSRRGVGRPLDLRRVFGPIGRATAPAALPARVLAATADGGLQRLLHGGLPGHDLYRVGILRRPLGLGWPLTGCTCVGKGCMWWSANEKREGPNGRNAKKKAPDLPPSLVDDYATGLRGATR